MSAREQVILAELTWTGQRFERDVAVHVGPDGTISRVEKHQQGTAPAITRLPRRGLLPGMVYAHSHAFQRALRNRPERFDTGSGNFWTWRDTMYRLVEDLDADAFYETCRRSFHEMLLAGVTSVGEFHYLHHDGGRLWALDDAILAAARDAGIRMALVQCFYATGGIGKPLSGAQRRFDAISVEAFLRQFEQLGGKLDPATQTLALACHSVRGARIEDVMTIYQRAVDADVPFHVHVEEQRQEIRDCVEAFGVGPLQLLTQRLAIDERFTAIHCTHSEPEDLREFFDRGGRVCLCPSTEGNLADGLPKLREMREAGARIAIGSDCNLRLCMTEDLRWLEFAHRLANEKSGNVVGDDGHVGPALFEMATRNGAGALKLPVGSIAPGNWADLASINLDHPSLVGIDDDSLMHALVFGCGNEPVDSVWVGGKQVISPPAAGARAG
jgi:formimidoylglutamate deiminase